MEIRRLEAAAGFDLDSPTEIFKRNTSPPPKKKKKNTHESKQDDRRIPLNFRNPAFLSTSESPFTALFRHCRLTQSGKTQWF